MDVYLGSKCSKGSYKEMVLERFKAAYEAFLQDPRDKEEADQEHSTQSQETTQNNVELVEVDTYYAAGDTDTEKVVYSMIQMTPLSIDVMDLSNYTQTSHINFSYAP